MEETKPMTQHEAPMTQQDAQDLKNFIEESFKALGNRMEDRLVNELGKIHSEIANTRSETAKFHSDLSSEIGKIHSEIANTRSETAKFHSDLSSEIGKIHSEIASIQRMTEWFSRIIIAMIIAIIAVSVLSIIATLILV